MVSWNNTRNDSSSRSDNCGKAIVSMVVTFDMMAMILSALSSTNHKQHKKGFPCPSEVLGFLFENLTMASSPSKSKSWKVIGHSSHNHLDHHHQVEKGRGGGQKAAERQMSECTLTARLDQRYCKSLGIFLYFSLFILYFVILTTILYFVLCQNKTK